MNERELIGAVLDLKTPPRLASTLMSAGAWALTSRGWSLEGALAGESEAVAEALYRAYTDAGSDIVWAMSGFNNVIVGAVGGKIKFRAKGTPDVVESLLKKPSDVDGLDVQAVARDAWVRSLLGATRALAKLVNGERYVALTRWGPWTLAGLLYGAENLLRDVYRNPDGVRRMLDFTVRLYLAYAELYFDNGVDFVLLAEPTASGDMISRKHFEAFALPAFKRVFEALKGKGVRTALHICGNIGDRLDLLNGIGTELISVDYKVSLARCREVFDGKTAFAGNVDPVGVMQRESPEGVRRVCEACVAEAGGGRGYLLMPGCDIPPSTPAVNIRAMTGTGRSL
ncbi:MAG: uroporphyrinogen decarboxylase family protein [Spirochaetaceae bacterium]|jgi:uroporphyrinogen decarboxylase|nr:uroporphyrinogen decarboxylase family protein [Spirochaetaceae bacterium]